MDWLPFVDSSHFPQLWHVAQTPTSNAASAPSIDLLRQQVEFLAKENARQGTEFTEKLKLLADENQKLSESFKTFVSAMKDGVYFVGILSGGAIALLTFLFGKSFREAKETAKASVTRQVEERMATIADNRIDVVRRSLEREVIVDQSRVEYWLLDAQASPRELGLLEARGFGVRFCNQNGQRRGREVDVVVLDLNNWKDDQGRKFAELSGVDKEQQVRRQMDVVRDGVARQSTVFVVYVAGRYDYLDEVGRDRLVSPTNNPVTLVGTVVDAAYLAAGNQ